MLDQRAIYVISLAGVALDALGGLYLAYDLFAGERGTLIFDPTSNAGQSAPGALSQTKAAFVYCGGADFAVSKHVALRAEYRGFVYTRPDFGLAALNSNVTTHTAQPSAGLVFRF